jgi:L-amino acid N-acyltransferase YncA
VPTGPRVRDADSLRDAAACAAIYAPYVRDSVCTFELDPPDERETALRIVSAQARHAWLVAESEGVVLGYAYAGPHNTREAYRWACSTAVYVEDGARGGGVGKALYAALLGRVAALGYLTATAGITLPNESSVSLHERFDFAEVARYRRIGFKLGAWRDVVWMQRDFVPTGADFPVPPAEPGPSIRSV